MNLHHLLRCVPLLVLLVLAAAGDLRDRRIRNWLSFLLILSGLLQSFFAGAAVGPWSSLAGMVIGAAIPLAMFAIGALGAGDVKLMAGVGAWLGPWPSLVAFALAALAGMFIVIVQAVAQRRTRVLFRNSAVLALNMVYVREVGVEHAAETGRSSRSVDRPLPYAVPVLAAVLLIVLCA